ncbi:hypothetical protein D1831_08395 [Lactiplantibacillus garii]|uniref:Uncharacterized protein n=1 Tax=Lactiplantibacillus garii TaxID=2306423 RepID=A0A3R8J7C5_9LACO|nr:hypothetical protein [Lactiplantibacillus garii]RRK10246.1 hypothetical protein D1831_08395 [Lactiplantibacillus garii]
MSISTIIMWTLVFIIATGFVTVISTAVLLRRAKKRPQDPADPNQSTDTPDDWKQDDWNHDDWKKGDWKD